MFPHFQTLSRPFLLSQIFLLHIWARSSDRSRSYPVSSKASHPHSGHSNSRRVPPPAFHVTSLSSWLSRKISDYDRPSNHFRPANLTHRQRRPPFSYLDSAFVISRKTKRRADTPKYPVPSRLTFSDKARSQACSRRPFLRDLIQHYSLCFTLVWGPVFTAVAACWLIYNHPKSSGLLPYTHHCNRLSICRVFFGSRARLATLSTVLALSAYIFFLSGRPSGAC